MGSVPNCQKEIPVHHAIRWFKCKLKPPKKAGKVLPAGNRDNSSTPKCNQVVITESPGSRAHVTSTPCAQYDESGYISLSSQQEIENQIGEQVIQFNHTSNDSPWDSMSDCSSLDTSTPG